MQVPALGMAYTSPLENIATRSTRAQSCQCSIQLYNALNAPAIGGRHAQFTVMAMSEDTQFPATAMREGMLNSPRQPCRKACSIPSAMSEDMLSSL